MNDTDGIGHVNWFSTKNCFPLDGWYRILIFIKMIGNNTFLGFENSYCKKKCKIPINSTTTNLHTFSLTDFGNSSCCATRPNLNCTFFELNIHGNVHVPLCTPIPMSLNPRFSDAPFLSVFGICVGIGLVALAICTCVFVHQFRRFQQTLIPQ